MSERLPNASALAALWTFSLIPQQFVPELCGDMAPDANGTKGKVMRLAGNLWTKLKDSVEDKLELEEDRPEPPPKLQLDPTRPSPYAAGQNPLPTFGNLTLSDNSPGQLVGNGSFVGGFHPALSASAPNLPRPPVPMPAPFTNDPQQQSIFMQMALRPDAPPRPHSNPMPTLLPKPPASGSPRPSTTGKPAPASLPSTPIKESKSESASISGTYPAKKPGQEQCSGVTKAGKRCTRMVKARPALLSIDSDDSNSLPRFCHQHSKELMTPSGYYSRKNGEWVKFEDWIPQYLHPDTQVSLRVEMEKARSQSDVPGYIYTFEIRDPEEHDTIKLKVGRAVNLVKRIDQWGKQCGSKEQVLRGFYPGSVEPDEASLMKGRVVAGEQGPWCHRLERLIHLELADLTSSYIYLDSRWPNIEIDANSETKLRDSNASKPCVDCGSMHKEIFEFKRWKRGRDREWGGLVKPIIERWGKFVELYV